MHVFAQLLALGFVRPGHFLTGNFQRAGRGLLNQGQGSRQGRLAAAGLTDHRQGFAGFQFKRHTVERPDQGMPLEQAAGNFIVTGQFAGGKDDGHYATSWFNG
ncbi:hypothetical protein D3C80_1429500 [compost metagenome]